MPFTMDMSALPMARKTDLIYAGGDSVSLGSCSVSKYLEVKETYA